MRPPHKRAWSRLAGATRLGTQGRRRYRVWWLAQGARAVCWRGDGLPGGGGRLRRYCRRVGAMGLACALVAALVDPRLLPLPVAMLLVGVAIAWLRAPRRREVALRRAGARPGPWVWAIDAISAVRTAEIADGIEAMRDQARRTPSMRIQSPSCLHSSWSNQAW